ncbi:MFS transporter [Candidatus Daviesbacteria bacterium]|nr:MFS transporter [Candidatus Daviesbacteria bacterium]
MNKKNVFLWSLYDFANSIVSVVFALYFSQWLVIDNKLPDIWYNLIFVGTTVLLLLTAPIAGSIADKIGLKMPFLTALTLGQFIALLLIGLLTNFISINLGILILIIILYMFANYFYQFQFVFYDALLYDIAPLKVRGFVSGLGQTANLLGQIAGLLITLPLISGAVFLIGNPGRAQTFLPATLIFFLLALPMLLFFKELTKPKKISINLLFEYRNSIKNFLALCRVPGVGRYLLGFFFFSDAILTAGINLPIYLEQVFHISDRIKAVLVVSFFLTAAIGAAVSGKIADKIGLKRSLLIILVCWVFAFPALSILTNFLHFAVLIQFFGFLYGGTIMATRAVMSYLAPPDKLTQTFGYFTLFERFSSFIGPVTWGLITLLLVNTGSLRYQIALASMTLFVLIGFILVRSTLSDNKGIQ